MEIKKNIMEIKVGDIYQSKARRSIVKVTKTDGYWIWFITVLSIRPRTILGALNKVNIDQISKWTKL